MRVGLSEKIVGQGVWDRVDVKKGLELDFGDARGYFIELPALLTGGRKRQ